MFQKLRCLGIIIPLTIASCLCGDIPQPDIAAVILRCTEKNHYGVIRTDSVAGQLYFENKHTNKFTEKEVRFVVTRDGVDGGRR